MLLKIVLLVLFFAVMIGVGIACRSTSGDVSGFVLGGNKAGSWLTAFAYGTSYFSAVIFVGYAGQFGWKYGISASWIGMGNAFLGSLLAWFVLGRRTRLMTRHLGSSTMPQYFGIRFCSPVLKTAASAIIFLFLIPYTASLYNGLSRLFGMAFGIDYLWCVLGMAVLTGVYVIVGGYMATAINDFIQGLIMLFGIIAVIAAVVRTNGGLMQAFISLSAIPSEYAPALQGAFISFFGPKPLELLGVVLLTSLGTWGLPQMVGKFYAIRNESAINKGAVISTVFAFIVAGGCYFLGGFGRLYAGQIEYTAAGSPVFDSIIPAMMSGLPDVLIGIVVILVLSASMSTLSSLVLTSASTLTLDVIVPFRERRAAACGTAAGLGAATAGGVAAAGAADCGAAAAGAADGGAVADGSAAADAATAAGMSERRKLRWIRLLIVFFIAVSSVIAIIQAKSSVTFIAQLMGISWGALAGAFLAPFLYGLYSRKATAFGAMLSFLSGIVIMCCCMFCSFTGRVFLTPFFSSPINAGVLAMLAGLVVMPLAGLFAKAPDQERIDQMFACYERKVTVRAADDLGRADVPDTADEGR